MTPATNSVTPDRGADLLTQRAHGAYYTPGDASAWMAQWLIDAANRS